MPDTLTTTWTEQSTVAFTAGTLSTITSCVTHVEGKLKRGTIGASSTPTTTQVQTELIRAKEHLMERFGFTWQRKYAYCSSVADQYRYAMPADYAGGRVTLRDTTNDRELGYMDPAKFDLKYPDPSAESSDKSDVYTVKNRELWLIPASAAVYTLELEYSRSGDDSTATDISYIPEVLRFKMCDFAVYQSFLLLHQWQAASLYKQEWMEGMMVSKREDNKKKWSEFGQALTWQQAYNAKYNQWS
jgi:hypothetical protein